MRIRIKVKHLVYMIVSLLCLLFLFSNLIQPLIEIYSVEKKIMAGKVEDKEEILEILRTTSVEGKKWEIVRKFMVGEEFENQYDVFISPSFSQWNGSNEEQMNFTWEEKRPFLVDYMENGPVNDHLVTVVKSLSFYYEREGELENAKDVLYETSKRFSSVDSYNREELLVERIRITKNHGELEQAVQYIEELTSELNSKYSDTYARIALLKTEILMQQGRMNEAYAEITEAINNFEDDYENEKAELPDLKEISPLSNRVYYQQLKTLEHSLRSSKDNNSTANVVNVTGKVLKNDGTPMIGIGVFLRNELNSSRSVSSEEAYHVSTDHEGRFVFNGVIPNRYQITLGFHSDQISGWTWPTDMNDTIEVDGDQDISYNVTLQKLIELKTPVNQKVLTDEVIYFEWEKVEGAETYSLSLGHEIEGGSMSFGYKSGIKENNIEVKTEDIYNISGSVAFGPEDAQNPQSFLGFTNPNSLLHWSVQAYDKDGNILTQSNGYRLDDESIGNLPFFYLKERELTSIDRLLLKDKPEEALEQYIEAYEKNPTDLHSLRMIIKLIGLKGDDSTETRDKLAISYMEDLAEKTSFPGITFDVANFYYEQSNWTAFNNWMDLYVAKGGELTAYIQSIYASGFMLQGEYEKAHMNFSEALSKDESHRFVGHWLANEIYRHGLSEDVKRIAEDYPEHDAYEDNPDWLFLIKNLMEESALYEHYDQELRTALDMHFSMGTEELEKWRRTTNLDSMKQFIKALDSVD